MPAYRLTRKAENDLTEAYVYSFEKFGEAQADIYALDLVACFQLLAEQPRLAALNRGRVKTDAPSSMGAI